MRNQNRKRTAWSAEVELWPEAYREWAELAAGAMIFANAPDEAVAPALAQVRESVAASGQSPTELFGEAIEFGRTGGRRLRRPSDILEGALPFNSASGAITVMLATLGMLLLVLGIWIGFSDGWNAHTFAGPVMLLFPMLTVLVAVGFWGWVLRTRGHLHAPLAIWGATLAGAAGTIALMSGLGGFEAPGPPNWAIAPVGLALVLAAVKLPEARPRALFDDTHWDDARYFTHAANLLRGRYLFTRARADRALAEARSHRRLSGTGTAAAEFGNVELFAAQLAAAERAAPTRGILLRRAGFSLVVAFFGFTIGTAYLEGPVTAWLVIQSVMWLCLAVMVVFSWRPTRINAEATKRQDERRADARTLAGHDED